ncbi:glycosyltransferase [Pedobacter sp. 22163]|uniref:glycosyltransferase n=1 Tax=Pedobacter sp. 22163 TaxID=3453883 RepID=UPI003F84464F
MLNFVSVIIPTYNPNEERLRLTLEGLMHQTLPTKLWELIIVDNNSSNLFDKSLNLGWHINAKIIKQPKQGLTFARLKGFLEAKGNIIVMIDDDNIVNENYLEQAIDILSNNIQLGCAGGISAPYYLSDPPLWLTHFAKNLALRNYGQDVIIEKWDSRYPEYAPIGAGMVIRKKALNNYINKITDVNHLILDRTGTKLSSGGDNDIVLEIIKSGWLVGYFPKLCLQHIIPKERMQAGYMSKLVYDSNISWIKILENHGINPWKKIHPITLLPRFAKAWVKNKAWIGGKNFIMWRSDCGMYKGLSEI